MKNFSKLQFELKTKRLSLKPLLVSDSKNEAFYDIDPEVCRYTTWSPFKNGEEVIQFLRDCEERFHRQDRITWGIFFEDKLIGIVRLCSIRWNMAQCEVRNGELGFWLWRDFWRKGFMKESVSKVLKFGFEQLQLHKIMAGHFSENKASEQFLKKIGFLCVGECKRHFLKDGKWHHRKVYEILESEFKM